MPRKKKKVELPPSEFIEEARIAEEEALLDVPEGEKPSLTGTQARDFHTLITEITRRSIEGLNLYEPLPIQEKFHRSTCRQRIIIGSNRSGKTLSAGAEIARAVTGQDPYRKYPVKDGRAYIIGKTLDHIGETMWWKLGHTDAFKMIRDEQLGQWRAFRPWEAADQQRKHLARPTLPLIPPRLIKDVAWAKKAQGIPKKVTLTTGWELNFYSAESKPPRGMDVDLVWLDEEILDEDWHPEMVARILDRNGKLIWSATPQSGTDQLYNLHETAWKEEAAQLPLRSVEEFVCLLAENPHIPEEQKYFFEQSLSEDEKQVRVQGEFALSQRKIYPEFSVKVHGCDGFPIPSDWTRYAVVDPGRQICAVLFAAVPPPSHGDSIYLYDELYMGQCTADKFGQAMAKKTDGQLFEAFIIDRHGGAIRDISRGESVEEQYSKALKRYRVKSRRTGSGFIWGQGDVDAGIEAVRGLLEMHDGALPRLRFVTGQVQHLIGEIRRYRYHSIKGRITGKPDPNCADHLLDTLRYLALFRPRYVHPDGRERRKGNGLVRILRDRQARDRQLGGNREGPVVTLGPTS